MTDRKIPPTYNSIKNIEQIIPQKTLLKNNVPVYLIDAGEQEITRVDFIFDAGNYYQKMPLLAQSTNAMLREGTTKMSSEEIAEKLDYYGSFLNVNSDQDFGYVTCYSLNKYMAQTLAIASDIIKNANFPDKEFEIFIQNRRQSYIIENEKVSVLTRNAFMELLYGQYNPYSNKIVLDDFDKISTNHLIEFHKYRYVIENCSIIVSGKIPENIVELLNENFCEQKLPHLKLENEPFEIDINKSLNNKSLHISKPGAIQAGIRIGREMFGRHHNDFIPFSILNTVLGGYFSSRLMANIREDKGYTYGIHSSIVPLKHSGYFAIITEVGSPVAQLAINEIFKEIAQLREELIPEQELNLVRNYISGELLRALDGPFGQASTFKTLLQHQLNIDYYKNFIIQLNSITPKILRDIANKYLQKDDLYQVVAG